jgi:hypothetical protein
MKFPSNIDLDPKLGKLHSKTNNKKEEMKKENKIKFLNHNSITNDKVTIRCGSRGWACKEWKVC